MYWNPTKESKHLKNRGHVLFLFICLTFATMTSSANQNCIWKKKKKKRMDARLKVGTTTCKESWIF